MHKRRRAWARLALVALVGSLVAFVGGEALADVPSVDDLTEVATGATGVVDDTKGAVDKVDTGVTEEIASGDPVEGVSTGVEDTIDVVEDTPEAVGTTVEDTTVAAGSVAEDVVDAVPVVSTQATETIASTVGDTGVELKTAIEPLSVGDPLGSLGDTVDKTTKGLGDTVDKTTKGLGDTVDKTTKGLGDTPGSATDGLGAATGDLQGGGAVNTGPSLSTPTDEATPPTKGVPGGGSEEDGRARGIAPARGHVLFRVLRANENSGGSDLASIVNGSAALLDSHETSEGEEGSGSSRGFALDLPFGLGTLPLSGASVIAFALTSVGLLALGWMMIRRGSHRRGRRGSSRPALARSAY